MRHPAPWRCLLGAGPWMVALPLFQACGCSLEPLCERAEDCPAGMLCHPKTGACHFECVTDENCGEGFECQDHRCALACGATQLDCPEGMVSVCGVYCIDRYEASRPDATAERAGRDRSRAVSRPGVLPWSGGSSKEMSRTIAAAACEAAGKKLCSMAQWHVACRGPWDTTYGYGDHYDPLICNAIDTFCDHCDAYPHCYVRCNADFHVTPTGAFEGCSSGFGAFDMNGNVWELVATVDGAEHYRGGAFNCLDSETLQRCDYDAAWNPAAKGFRCCAPGRAPAAR